MKYIIYTEYSNFLMENSFASFQIYDVKVFKGQCGIKWNARCQEALMIKFVWESFIKNVTHFQLKLH